MNLVEPFPRKYEVCNTKVGVEKEVSLLFLYFQIDNNVNNNIFRVIVNATGMRLKTTQLKAYLKGPTESSDLNKIGSTEPQSKIVIFD